MITIPHIYENHAIQFDPVPHKYTLGDKVIPSVSQIINLSTAPARLHDWIRNNRGDAVAMAAKDIKTEMACDFGTESHEHVEKLVGGQMVESSATLGSVLGKIRDKNITPKVLEESASRISTRMRDQLGAKPVEASTISLVRHAQSENTIKFIEEYEAVPLGIECRITGKDDLYTGTVDFVGINQFGLLVADWKTNQKTASNFKKYKVPGYTVQIAAYCKPIEARQGVIVHLHTGTCYPLNENDIDRGFAVFQKLLNLYHAIGVPAHAADVCRLWNTGANLQDICRKMPVGPTEVSDIIRTYQLI